MFFVTTKLRPTVTPGALFCNFTTQHTAARRLAAAPPCAAPIESPDTISRTSREKTRDGRLRVRQVRVRQARAGGIANGN